MAFRTVVVDTRCKLELKMNYLVFRGEEVKRVFIDEISTLLIATPAVTITGMLLSELVKHGVKVIFCDEKHNPQMELLPYYDNYITSKKILNQIQWDENIKKQVWTKIVKQKILMQAKFLLELGFGKEYSMLMQYADECELNDSTNREGHSAKVYFNTIFADGWHRGCEDFKDRALNYGYTILLSAFNREIIKCGYLTQLGIWHKNPFNNFNLSSDLMEPFRILIDKIVLTLDESDKEYKLKLINVLNQKVFIDGKEQLVTTAIEIYVNSVFRCLNEQDISLIKFYD